MKLSELILHVGDENVSFQDLIQSSTSINSGKKDGKITFSTDKGKTLDLARQAALSEGGRMDCASPVVTHREVAQLNTEELNMKTRGSLGGQNTVGRHTGARSSRALSTLFKKLRALDRRIGELDRWIRVSTLTGINHRRNLAERERLDSSRKDIRTQRKQH